jgi:dihydrofolate synthase/folylpolyglutamate synthase
MTVDHLESFADVERYLLTHVPRGPRLTFPGEQGLARMRYLLHLLGDPQEQLTVIHIAGTSGKGSTAYLTSTLLRASGFHVGLHLSPHLIDIRERLQIDNAVISREDFVQIINRLLPVLRAVGGTHHGSPTYFEILVAAAYQLFAESKVDYAVVETGLGGLLDGTNTIERRDKVAVLTRIGLDHTDILGKRLRDIAAQKAAIIHQDNSALSAWQHPQARAVIDAVAAARHASLHYLRSGVSFRRVVPRLDRTTFDFASEQLRLPRLELGLIGRHQAENASLALAATALLARRDGFELDDAGIRTALRTARFPGRFEVFVTPHRPVIIDGAHNPQKVTSLVRTLDAVTGSQRYDMLVAFKAGKDYPRMLQTLLPRALHITITSFFRDNQDVVHLSAPVDDIAATLTNLGFTNYHVVPDPIQALESALCAAADPLLITGSLYLLAELRPRLKRLDHDDPA